jgi:hypothetical protein
LNDFEDRRTKIKGWVSSLSLQEPYLLLGTAHPERALLNIPEFSFRGEVSGSPLVGGIVPRGNYGYDEKDCGVLSSDLRFRGGR